MSADTRTLLPVLWFGAGRGAEATVNMVRDFGRKSRRAKLAVRYVDAIPGRADELADRLSNDGINAIGVEADVRELVPVSSPTLVVVQVDNARTAAEVLAKNVDADVLVALLLRFSDERVAVLVTAACAGEVEERGNAVLLLSALAVNAAEGGSSFLVGVDARTPQRITVELLRAFINKTFSSRLEKRLAGLPVAPGMVMSTDGRASVPVIVRDARKAGFSNPAAVAYDEIDSPRSALRPGESVLVAEIGFEAEIRLHRVGRRAVDGAVTVTGRAVMDPRGLSPLAGAAWVAAEAERRELMGDAERTTVSRTNAVYVTD